jgi:manganese-dependent ADP-ribose/CDP-alcohol diphosphatase
MRTKYLLLALFIFCLPFQEAYSQNPLFSFGLVADIQYADADKEGSRDYRNSLEKLDKCIREFNNQNLSFIVSLGDMIDRDYSSYDKPLAILDKSKAPVYNTLGNHDFSVDDPFKSDIKEKLNNPNGYLDFEVGSFNFIIMDGSDVSTLAYVEGTTSYNTGMAEYERMKQDSLNNAYEWNGGIGPKQLKWMEKRLKKAVRTGRKVILFCHWPLLPENGTQLWNNKEVLALLDNYDCVVAWISGHHHAGNYQKPEKIHHLTIKGLVEAQSDNSCGIVEVYSDSLVLKGYGDQDDQVLDF